MANPGHAIAAITTRPPVAGTRRTVNRTERSSPDRGTTVVPGDVHTGRAAPGAGVLRTQVTVRDVDAATRHPVGGDVRSRSGKSARTSSSVPTESRSTRRLPVVGSVENSSSSSRGHVEPSYSMQ